MVRLNTIIFFFLILLSRLNAQVKIDPIMAIKLDADSVWVLSHEVTGVYIGYDDSKSKSEERVLFKAGKLDSSLIKENHLLAKAERYQLARLLARPNTETKIETATCFMPQHAIIWRKAGNVSWIEVCFSCQKIRGSKNYKSAIPELDNPKWAALRSLFKQMGLTYEL